MATTATTALVADYRARIALDPEDYDGDADVVLWLVEDTADRDWVPSQVARVAGISTTTARNILAGLAAGGLIARDERGAWSRFWARRR